MKLDLETKKERLENLKQKKTDLENELFVIKAAGLFISDVAKKTQGQLKIAISGIVQTALDLCFPNEYNFKFDFVETRGRIESKFCFEDKNGNEVSILDASGGGVVDVVTFALRIACYTLSSSTDTIILDEPFKFVSVDMRGKVSALLKDVSEKLGIQFIVVTHDSSIIDVADRVFKVVKTNEISEVTVK